MRLAAQGVLVAIGRASVVGHAGNSEGYYALPHREHWHPDWASAFEATRADGVEVIDLGGLGSLRHTFATLMLEQGENPKVVQEILGHSQITHTMDTYSHVTPNMQRAAFSRLGERLQKT